MVWPLHAQEKVITGIVFSDDHAHPMALVNILQINTQKRYLSSRKGIFRIPEAPTDSFRFTSVGYSPVTITGSEMLKLNTDTILVLMHSGSYLLKDVTITYSKRKRDSIARIVADIFRTDSLLNNNRRILNRPRGCVGSDVGLGYTGALTEMYYEYSKEGKDMKHFEEYVSFYRLKQEADYRYNKQTIKQMTSLPDNYLDAFILFCKMDRNFIIQASEYDFVKAVKDCEARFRVSNKGLGKSD